MTTDLIIFLAVCAASALVAWASTRDISRPPQQNQKPWTMTYYEGPVRMPDIGH